MRVCVSKVREKEEGKEVNKGLEGQSAMTHLLAPIAGPAHSSHMSPDACEERSSIRCLACA